MKKVRTLCVIIFLIFTIFIPTINATTVKEEYQNKIIEKIYLIKSIVSKDDHISQNPYNITNFWDWFLFVFLPWFYLNFPNLFNLTRLSILLLIVIFDRLVTYVIIPAWYIIALASAIILSILEKIFGEQLVMDIVSIILGILFSIYEKILSIYGKIFSIFVKILQILGKFFFPKKLLS